MWIRTGTLKAYLLHILPFVCVLYNLQYSHIFILIGPLWTLNMCPPLPCHSHSLHSLLICVLALSVFITLLMSQSFKFLYIYQTAVAPACALLISIMQSLSFGNISNLCVAAHSEMHSECALLIVHVFKSRCRVHARSKVQPYSATYGTQMVQEFQQSCSHQACCVVLTCYQKAQHFPVP
jgi:hypothetical protein